MAATEPYPGLDPIVERLADALVVSYDAGDLEHAEAVLDTWDVLDGIRLVAARQAATS